LPHWGEAAPRVHGGSYAVRQARTEGCLEIGHLIRHLRRLRVDVVRGLYADQETDRRDLFLLELARTPRTSLTTAIECRTSPAESARCSRSTATVALIASNAATGSATRTTIRRRTLELPSDTGPPPVVGWDSDICPGRSGVGRAGC